MRSLPYQYTAAAEQCHQRHDRYHREQAVQSIEEAAVAGDQAARIFHAEPALGDRLGKIAELLDDRKRRTDQHHRECRRNAEPGSGRPTAQRGADRSAGEPCPGLSWTPAWRQARTAQHLATDIGPDISGPDDSEHP